ncbi:MAG: dihydroorotate dehydrogenase [Phycisphaerales bacterium]|nr:dihydroorotate dehydrogenase [Phycisphaerales bacterium]MCB9863909.1 dihydroorotate dehydrogenase [Phycisphaerales bacterium]
MSAPDLSIRLGPAEIKNPVMTASGTCGYGPEYGPYTDLSMLGAFTTKSVTLKPRKGNAPQRIVETPGGMLNAIGLANVGIDEFERVKAPEAAKIGTTIFANVAGHSIQEYVAVCERIDAIDAISGIELNVSCPNVSDGLTFGTDARLLAEVTAECRKVIKRGALIVKLSPNVTDITEMARAAIDGGADALSMINTLLGMKIDINKRRPVIANRTGGLSGPCIRPVAIHLVNKVYNNVAKTAGIPIVGMGGITNWQDAIEFFLAGATAVSVGTALFTHPDAPMRIIAGIEDFLRKNGVASVRDLVGALNE